MKRLILSLLVLAQFTSAFAQDIAGVWQGILTQPSGGLASSYAFFLNLEQKGEVITGFSRIEIANTPNFGVLELEGKIVDNELTFSNTKVMDENLTITDSYWCLINSKLKYNPTTGSLEGDWTAGDECGPGEILVYKSDMAFNSLTPESYEQGNMTDLKNEISDSTSKHVKVVLKDLRFASGSDQLNTESKAQLEEVYQLLKDKPSLKLKITGHTDAVGSDKDNFNLSQKRAKSAYDHLVKKGIDSKRLIYEGYGESRPIGDNEDEKGRELNRRLEIEILM